MSRDLISHDGLHGDPTGPGSPVRDLARARGRAVIRRTASYVSLLEMLLRPAALADPSRAAVRLESLLRDQMRYPAPPRYWRLFEQERESMAALDIPYFWFRADDTRVWCRTGLEEAGGSESAGAPHVSPGVDALPAAPFADLCRRIAALTPAEGRGAADAVAYALSAPRYRPGEAPAIVGERHRAASGAARLADEVRAIARFLCTASVDNGRGGHTWIGLAENRDAKVFRTAGLACDLYEGTAGIALFLVAAGRVLEEPEALALGERVLCEVADYDSEEVPGRIAGAANRLLRNGALGPGAAGRSLVIRLGGAMAGWADASQKAWNALRPSLANIDAWASIAPGRSRWHAWLDFLSGRAGAVFVAASLAAQGAASGEEYCREAVALATRAAQPILRLATSRAGEPLARAIAGMSHGLSGMALACGALAAACHRHGRSAERDASIEAALKRTDAERALYRAEEGEWLDGRAAGAERFTTAWCHGSAGIGLARAGLVDLLSACGVEPDRLAGIRMDLERAVERLLRCGVEAADFVCCGNAGRIEALLVAGERLGRPDLIDAARARMLEVLERAAREGRYGFPYDKDGAPERLGFFDGLTGIGYHMLRCLAHRDVPSVLLPEMNCRPGRRNPRDGTYG